MLTRIRVAYDCATPGCLQEPMFTGRCLAVNCRLGTVLYLFGTVQLRDRSVLPLPGILWGNLSANYHVIYIIYIIYMTRSMSYFNTVGKIGSTAGEY